VWFLLFALMEFCSFENTLSLRDCGESAGELFLELLKLFPSNFDLIVLYKLSSLWLAGIGFDLYFLVFNVSGKTCYQRKYIHLMNSFLNVFFPSYSIIVPQNWQ
jgi:hypothetical protein